MINHKKYPIKFNVTFTSQKIHQLKNEKNKHSFFFIKYRIPLHKWERYTNTKYTHKQKPHAAIINLWVDENRKKSINTNQYQHLPILSYYFSHWNTISLISFCVYSNFIDRVERVFSFASVWSVLVRTLFEAEHFLFNLIPIFNCCAIYFKCVFISNVIISLSTRYFFRVQNQYDCECCRLKHQSRINFEFIVQCYSSNP